MSAKNAKRAPDPILWRVIVSALRSEYNSIERSQFITRLGRFRDTFLLIQSWVVTEEELDAYVLYNEWNMENNAKQIDVARGLMTTRTRELKFKDFISRCSASASFDEIVGVFQSYPEVFVLQK